MCYISASIGKKVFPQIVLFDSHVAEKWGSGGLPSEKCSRQRPLEHRKTLFLQSRI